MIRSFFGSTLGFRVPDPTPEDDVIQHTWLKTLQEERIAIIFQWKSE